jgi:DNA-binding transcriptional MocR family regulator
MTAPTQYRIAAANAAELVRSIEQAVVAGELEPGERLPSVRNLAREVGLSPVTVSAALAELRRRGIVITEDRRGTRIGPAPPVGAARPALPVPAGARDLSRGNPDPALLPDPAGALAHIPLPKRLYGERPVIEQLARLAREQLEDDGVSAHELCVVSGALDGIERVLQAHTRPGDRVAVESPGYAALYDLLRAQGLLLEPVELDDRGILPASLGRALEHGVTAVVVTPRGQNPTGAALDAERAQELRAVLGGHPDVLLIEDDHLGPIAGTTLHTLTAGRRRWAATRSVAKALGPDLRLAVLAGDPETVARVEGRQQCGPGWVSHILQSLVLALWRDEAVAEQVARAGELYGGRRRALLEELARRGVAATGASGLNVWVPVHEEAGAVAALLQRGWVVAPGAPYRLGDSEPAIRVTTATLGPAEARRLADDIAAVLAGTGASRSG